MTSVLASEHLTHRALFDRLAPYYLSIGMSLEEYWNGDAALVLTYFQAELCRAHRKQRELWYSGIYLHRAVAACFSGEAEYFDEPLPVTLEDAERQNRRRQASAQALIEARFRAWGNSAQTKGGQPE